MEQLSDFNVESLKWNTYTTLHASRPRGHCRKGCKKSRVSETGDKYSKKNVFWLQQTNHSDGECMDKTCKKPNQPKSRLGIGSGTWWFLNEEETVLCNPASVGPCMTYVHTGSTKQTQWMFKKNTWNWHSIYSSSGDNGIIGRDEMGAWAKDYLFMHVMFEQRKVY